MHTAKAKLFASGGSQAVRLPAEFRFEDVTEVYVRRDDMTSRQPWHAARPPQSSRPVHRGLRRDDCCPCARCWCRYEAERP
nr:hypothetical protein [Variovorax sp. YR216]